MGKRRVTIAPAGEQGPLVLHNKRDEDEESGERSESEDDESLFRNGRLASCCSPIVALSCCAVCVGVLTLVIVVLCVFANTAAKTAIEAVGGAVLGVEVTVDSVAIALLSARSSISGVVVQNPPGFSGSPFLQLSSAVFDLRLLSLMVDPLELQEISVHGLEVSIDQLMNMDSNAKRIVDHVNQVTAGRLPTPSAQSAISDGLHVLTKKIKADRIEFFNISAQVCAHPLCDLTMPARFTIPQVRIADVGKQRNGVYMYELVEIMLQTILRAAIQGAPGQVGQNMLQAFGSGLRKALDYGQMHLDVGEGLTEAGAWTEAQLDRFERVSTAASDVLVRQIEGTTDVFEEAIKNSLGSPHSALERTVQKALGNATKAVGLKMEGLVQNATHSVDKVIDGWAKKGAAKAVEGLGDFLAGAFGTSRVDEQRLQLGGA